jgi:hypothetical protein
MKQRPNKLDPFGERLDAWAAEGRTLAQMREELRKDGVTVAVSQIGEFLARRRQAALEERLFGMISNGARMNSELDRAYEAAPAPEVERLIQVTKTLIMSLQVEGAANPDFLKLANSMQQTVLNYLTGVNRARIEERKLELQESKYRDLVAEKKRAIESELTRAKAGGGITEETIERIERELKLL